MLPTPIGLALSLLLAPACATMGSDEVTQSGTTGAGIVKVQANRQQGHLSTDDRVRDLLSHPSFAGFGRLILPWDNRVYDENMPRSSLGSLLPYHSHVRPEIVVGALNHMIDEANSGKPIFHDFYTEAEKKEQPEKRNTGLFFLRGKPGAPFAIISPGGGFSYVGSIH